MLPSEIVNPNITRLCLRGLEARAKPHKPKCKAHGFYGGLKIPRSPHVDYHWVHRKLSVDLHHKGDIVY